MRNATVATPQIHKGASNHKMLKSQKSLYKKQSPTSKQGQENLKIEDEIIGLLLANDANLLAVICQASFVGDTAASVSLGVLSLLNKRGSKTTEEFLKRLFRTRIEEYMNKSRDLSDIVRDNSMATMLLNAFARSEGSNYLNRCLQDPLNNVIPSTPHCEVDPFKLGAPQNVNYTGTKYSHLFLGSYIPTSTFTPNGEIRPTPAGPDSEQEQLIQKVIDQVKNNEDCLKSCCSILISSIINNKDYMPESMRRMCFFLKSTIQDIFKELKMFEREEDEISKASSPTESKSSGLESPIRNKHLMNAHPETINESQEFCNIGDRGEAEGSVELTFDSSRKNLPVELGSNENSSLEPSPINDAPGSVGAKKPKDRRKYRSGIKWSRVSQTSIMNTSTSSQNRTLSGGHLDVSEKVVGSFLFLRFFVPAITSPDTYGLVSTRVTPASRRGLILCGKVLTAICNDIDFGHKEQYLQNLNPYLHQNRELVKNFIDFVATDVEEEIDDNGNSTFLDKINSEQASERATLNRKNIEADINNFFLYIGRSLGKIEAEVNEQMNHLTEEEGEGVLKNFQKLKSLMAEGPYAATAPSGVSNNSSEDDLSSSSGKSSDAVHRWWLARLLMRMGLLRKEKE